MRVKEIYWGSRYRVRDWEEMVGDPKLKVSGDSIVYPRGHNPFTPDMKHLCGEEFFSFGLSPGGYVYTSSPIFQKPDGHGKYLIDPWMLESVETPYKGRRYSPFENTSEAVPEYNDEERSGLIAAILGIGG